MGHKLLIDGKLVPGALELDVVNPTTGEVFTRAPRADQKPADAQIAVNSQLKMAFEQRAPDLDAIQSYLKEAAVSNIALDVPGLEYAIRKRLEAEAEVFASAPTNAEEVQKLTTLLKFASTFPFPVNLWEVQNICYGPLIKTMDELRAPAPAENAAANTLLDGLAQLRENLRIDGKRVATASNSG